MRKCVKNFNRESFGQSGRCGGGRGGWYGYRYPYDFYLETGCPYGLSCVVDYDLYGNIIGSRCG